MESFDDIDYNFDSKNVIHEPYIEKTYDIYGKYNNKLPYKISENEIKKIKDGTQHNLLYRWYSLVKYTFNIFLNNISAVEKFFNKESDDRELVENCIPIISNYLHNSNSNIKSQFNYHHEKLEIPVTFSNLVKFFDMICKSGKGSIYLRNIIHGNIYSAMVTYYKYRIREKHLTIENICNAIKNDTRKNSIKYILTNKNLHKKGQSFDTKTDNYGDKMVDYYKYLMRCVGDQQDIYNKWKRNPLVLGLDFETYNEIEKFNREKLDYCKRIYKEFMEFVLEGFVTDPDIIDDVEINGELDNEYEDKYKILKD